MKLIDKSALVAEIERIMKEQQEICKADVALGKAPDSKNIEVIYQFQQFTKFLDTLEVKEICVDTGFPEGDYNSKTVQFIDADGNIKEITVNKAQNEKSALEAAQEEKVDNRNCVKPANKVEPKFKVGDWIVKNNDSHINIDYSCCKITKVENKNYTIESIYGYKGYNTLDTFERDYHLWTIQDAKDGDVLATEPIEGHSSPFVAIYKERGLDFFNSYCFIGFNSKFYKADSGHSTEKIHPATKEQRDLLFQKMKEAGYEWDAEKKELRKVKKAPQKFMVGDTIKYNGTEYKITEITPNGYKVYALTYDEDAASLISFSAPAILVEQKPAWSEEDEDNFKHLLDEIVCLGNNRNSANRLYYDRLIKFIKELKNRAQPKEKWCDKDERMLDRLIAYFEKQVAFTDDDNPRYANWLKSLRPQKQWKPSDEQVEALKYACGGNYVNLGILESLYQDLKKLKG